MADVRGFFKEEGKINLFAQLDANGQATDYAAEAFFDQIYLNRLRANFVFSLDAGSERLAPMYDRGLRISQLGSGAKRIELDPLDIESLLEVPIRAMTYLPWKSLTPDILQRRFGTPAEKRAELETGVTHWLYPDKGMEIAIDRDGGVVIQYVNTEDFDRLLTPLGHLPPIEDPAREGLESQPDSASGPRS